MSRIGKQPIRIPTTVRIAVENSEIKISGPKGELLIRIPMGFTVVQEEDLLGVRHTVKDRDSATSRDTNVRRLTKSQRQLFGTFRQQINNAIQGTESGYRKSLDLHGVGFRAEIEEPSLILSLGFSHPVKFDPPDGIKLSVEKNVIHIDGIDKALVGEVAARIRRLRPPDPYKGKGIRYLGEQVRLRPGKTVKAVAGVGG